MASWKEERDRLVAQTLAFVQQVASAHPGAAQKLGLQQATAASRAAIEPAPTLATNLDEEDVSPAPVADIPVLATAEPIIVTVATESEEKVAVAAEQSIMASLGPRPTRYSTQSERADIGSRVAAFKARQSQLNHERDAYYQKMQARIRATLRNDSGPDPL